MAPSPLAYRRTHNTLLFQKLLNLRDGASPFTLLLDNLEQSARPLLGEFITRAKISSTRVMFVSFTTLRTPNYVDIFISARKKPLATIHEEIASCLPPLKSSKSVQDDRTLLVIDSLFPLCAHHASLLSIFLSGLLGLRPGISMIAVYHLGTPIPPHPSRFPSNEYVPDPLAVLTYLATSILRVSSLSHTLERKRARDKSIPEPGFGLEEDREGAIFGLRRRKIEEENGLVVEMEVRRRSGRGVKEVFVLNRNSMLLPTKTRAPRSSSDLRVILLDDHSLYAPLIVGGAKENDIPGNGGSQGQDVADENTFSLGLTEKQRRDRDGVVLPYFDAQNAGDSGEGGRILYEMDRGDDFDEEEDEL